MTAERSGARGNAGSFRSAAGGSVADPDAADLYAVLGVAADAAPEDVRAAYRALMKRYHPDRGADPQDHAAAAAINRAMRVIGDPQRRRAYDRSRRPTATAEPRRYPLVVVPVRPRARRGPALAIIVGALALAAVVAWLAPQTPATATSGNVAGDEPDEPAVDRTLVQTVMQQASLDLEWIALYNGAAGAERFSRNCYAELAQAASPPLLLFCAAIDARGARLFPGRSPYFRRSARQARFGRAAALLSAPVAGLWQRVETEARLLHEGSAPPVVAEPSAGEPRHGAERIDVTVDP